MVRSLYCILLYFLTIPSMMYAQAAYIDASVNQNQGAAHQPIRGTITITHDTNATINSSSFKIDNQSLQTQFVQTVPMSSGQTNTAVSIYNFELPPKDEGLYVLSPISVEVDNKHYQSSPASYEISERIKAPTPVQPTTVNQKSTLSQTQTATTEAIEGPPIFKLEAFVEGPTPLYPGQRAKLVYRITYNRDVDLTQSHFPLLYNQDFKKVGDAHIEDYSKDGMSIQDIKQEIETSKPGTFHYGPSFIAGYAYQLKSNGQKQYNDPLLSATAPDITIEVAQFPLSNQPASFNGTIATTFDPQLKMLSPETIELGDSINLELTVSGPMNLDEMNLPPLACQPGFSGFFDLDDLPPLADVSSTSKKFTIELRPISTFAQAIPSIELSAFNPQTNDYIIWHSKPIPLNLHVPIAEKQAEPDPAIQLISQTPINMASAIERSDVLLPAITDFVPILMTSEDLTFSWIRTPAVLFLIPIASLCLLWILRKRWYLPSQMVEMKKSQQLVNEACSMDSSSDRILPILRQACLYYIQEHEYESAKFNQINTFMDKLDQLQYGRVSDQNDWSELCKEARLILHE